MPTGIGSETNNLLLDAHWKPQSHTRLSPSRILANLHIRLSMQQHNTMLYRSLSNTGTILGTYNAQRMLIQDPEKSPLALSYGYVRNNLTRR